MDYQARVTAWAAVHMLAEKDADPPFGLKAPVVRMACEGPGPVDDLIVSTDTGRTAYVQVKRTVPLSEVRYRAGRLAPFPSAVDQFVRQFLLGRAAAGDGEDPSDAAHDRFVLAVGADAPATIRVKLREALERVRVYPRHELPVDGLDKGKRKALDIVVQHIRASWKDETGCDPSDHDVRRLLDLLRVETIEVDEEERDEREAKRILRAIVLETPEQADVAWSKLIARSLRLIGTRGHADRATLLEALNDADVSIRAPRSYRGDVQCLRSHSTRVADRLAAHAFIQLGDDELRIRRPYVPLLRRAAEAGSVLLVGEPGAGKSGLLHSLSEALRKEGCEVLLLAAEQPPFESAGGLRDELRLEHDVVDVLANWPGTRPAFLLVDALDAARTGRSADALRDLIREVSERGDRWRVVASIREYDARYSRDLPDIFKGTPPDGPEPPLVGGSFSQVRHVVVGLLTDDELRQIGELGAPELAQLLESAPTAVAELLRNPFNLRLAAELLDGGTDPQAIRNVGSQLDLLGLYWQERVFRGGTVREARSRETVLRKAVEAMSRERALHVDRDLVETEVAAGPQIHDLLSEQVIVEWRPRPEAPPRASTLAFAHHVLFDYAVARLLLRCRADRVASFLAEDRAFVLLGRPSLVMHFHYLWALDAQRAREEFWETVLAVCGSPEIPEIGKLIGPSVAGEIGLTIQEFAPLLAALGEADEAVRKPAESALAHCVQALLADRGSQPETVGLCCDLAKRLSESFTTGSAYPASWILSELVPRLDQLSAPQAEQVGTASRRLLGFAWAQSRRDRWFVGKAIRFVCRTFDTDAEASSKLLRRAIEPDHLAQHGSEELRWLADALPSMTPHNPTLVRDIYRAAFGYRETSGSPTSVLGSTVLPLTSNRSQDYQIGLHQLLQAYPEFLRGAPTEAVAAMDAALEWHVASKPAVPKEDAGESAEFDFRGERALIRTDYSRLWDRGQGHPNETTAVELLDHVEQRLQDLTDGAGGAVELANLLDTLARTCRLAAVWRRLLDLGVRYPAHIGMRIRAAGWSLPVLMCPDTTRHVGSMNGALFLDLSETDREKIERAILSIPAASPPERRSAAEQTRDQLLGCLPGEGLVTSECREHLSALRAASAVPPNEDDVKFEFFNREFGEEEFLAQEGVPVEEEPNKCLRELEEPVKAFANAHRNEVPTSQALAAAFPHMKRLHTALQSSEAEGVHEKLANYAWGNLAEACAAAAKMEDLRCHEGAGAFVRMVLLEASEHRVPTAERDSDERFVEGSREKLAARVAAAAGLMTILRYPSCEDPHMLTAVDRLAADPAPSVRREIAFRVLVRYERNPDWTWRLIERMARDRSLRVLQWLVHPLRHLMSEESARVAAITIGIRQAIADAPDRNELVNSCGNILADLFVWGKDTAAAVVINDLADHPVAHLEEVAHLVRRFREILVSGSVNTAIPETDAARRRSWNFLLRVVRGAAAEFRRDVERQENAQDPSEKGPRQEQMEGLARLLDSVGSNIYYVSGAYDGTDSPSEPALRRLYAESAEVIDELADVGLPSLAHHLLEALAAFIAVDPRGVFLRIARVIRGGRQGGYQYDSMAEQVLVRIVDRYLADYRELFRTDAEMQKRLIDILDTFVKAGSEGARRLSYGLDGIFR
ncbi:hypothetical protein [Candidatus Palauibacter sp.]|uniref:hypothetical protein n=1 Tax=Candidatus Palauibacter sp. TaxID=3101350 RepID=UPI003B526DDC